MAPLAPPATARPLAVSPTPPPASRGPVRPRPIDQIPPDMAAVLLDAPIHPDLLRSRGPAGAAQPSAAALTAAALAIAASAAVPGRECADLPPGAVGLVHDVGPGGVLHLAPVAAPRTVSVVRGTLDQRGGTRPRLLPGTVRLVPAGHCVTLADLAGHGALVVEVTARTCPTGPPSAAPPTAPTPLVRSGSKLDEWKITR